MASKFSETMHGQLSLEALVLFAIGFALLAFLFPAVSAAQNAGEQMQEAASARLILNQLAAACETARITEEQQTVEILSMGNFSLTGKPATTVMGNHELTIRFGNNSRAANTTCTIFGEKELVMGRNMLVIGPTGTIS